MEILISELFKFSESILEVGLPIVDNRVEEFESYYNLKIPDDFKEFIKKVNGINLMGKEVYGFDKNNVNSSESIYYREHFDIIIPQYSYLVPFYPDGGGNFYCLDTLNKVVKGQHPIVFWVSNYEYSVTDTPEITHINFQDWFKEVVIEWTLEDYNYDGSKKQNLS